MQNSQGRGQFEVTLSDAAVLPMKVAKPRPKRLEKILRQGGHRTAILWLARSAGTGRMVMDQDDTKLETWSQME